MLDQIKQEVKRHLGDMRHEIVLHKLMKDMMALIIYDEGGEEQYDAFTKLDSSPQVVWKLVFKAQYYMMLCRSNTEPQLDTIH